MGMETDRLPDMVQCSSTTYFHCKKSPAETPRGLHVASCALFILARVIGDIILTYASTAQTLSSDTLRIASQCMSKID